jgi:hypothetical protein
MKKEPHETPERDPRAVVGRPVGEIEEDDDEAEPPDEIVEIDEPGSSVQARYTGLVSRSTDSPDDL